MKHGGTDDPPSPLSDRPSELRTDAFFTLDASTDVLHLKAGFEQFGYSRDRVDGGTDWWLERVHPDDRDRLRRAIDPLVERPGSPRDERDDGGRFSERFLLRRADGSYVYCHGRGLLLVDAGPSPTLVGTLTDITERVRAEERFETLLERSSDLITILGEDGRVEYQSPSVEPVLGYSPAELIGECAFDYIHPDDRDRVRTAFEDGVDADLRFSAEYRFRRTDGTWCWLESVSNNQLTNSLIGGFVTNSREITERKQYERALAALNDVGVDLDVAETAEEICTRTIEASERVLAFDLSVVDIEEGGMLSEMAISEDLPEIWATTMSVEEGLAGKTYRTGDSFLVDDLESHPDAEPQGPYRSAVSVPIGRHGVFQAVDAETGAFDETDLELAELLARHTASALDRLEREQQVRRKNERLEQFTRIASHDLRNPMAAAKGYLDLARAECDTEHLEEVADALARMETIVEETLTLARDGRLVDGKESVRLETIAENCWQNVATGTATLDVRTGGGIRADPDRLRHVFENLFRNAVEHGGTAVTVSVGGLEDGFYVEDDGPGLPEDEREAVFERDGAAREPSALGLTIVRQVAEAHGWDVRATDGTEGGARFEFSERTGPDR